MFFVSFMAPYYHRVVKQYIATVWFCLTHFGNSFMVDNMGHLQQAPFQWSQNPGGQNNTGCENKRLYSSLQTHSHTQSVFVGHTFLNKGLIHALEFPSLLLCSLSEQPGPNKRVPQREYEKTRCDVRSPGGGPESLVFIGPLVDSLIGNLFCVTSDVAWGDSQKSFPPLYLCWMRSIL